MKRLLLFLTFLFSIIIFGCKCNQPTIPSSFEEADFVFIGEVYDVNRTYKTGFFEVENALSKVKIIQVFKSPRSDFSSTEVTFFGQQFNSCDIMLEKGQYLIFAYVEPDTTFFYSSHCLATKELSQVTKAELKLLNDLQQEFEDQLNTVSTEEIDYDPIMKTPDKIINELKFQNKQLITANKSSRIYLVILAVLLAISLIMLLILRRRNKTR